MLMFIVYSSSDADALPSGISLNTLPAVMTHDLTSIDAWNTINSVYGTVTLSITDANGVITHYAYDAMHRLTSISYPADATRNISFAYDAAGHVTAMTDAGGITHYTRDVVGRITSASWNPAGSTLTFTVAYTYDAAGRLFTLTYPTGRVVTYTYDTAGRINAVDASINGAAINLVSAIQYNALGNIVSRTLGNGTVETRHMDNRGRLTAITAAGVLSRTLGWNPDSTLASITDNLNTLNAQSFTYDPAGRLTNATGAYGSLAFSYDANGNRLSKTSAASAVSSTYEPATNRLAASGATPYIRDAVGNRLSDNQFNYTYAANNRLIAVSNAAGIQVAGYVHNGKGERVIKTVNGITIYDVYDLAGHLIGVYDAGGVMQAEHFYDPSGRIVTIRNEQRPVVLNKASRMLAMNDGWMLPVTSDAPVILLASNDDEDMQGEDEHRKKEENEDKNDDKDQDGGAGNAGGGTAGNQGSGGQGNPNGGNAGNGNAGNGAGVTPPVADTVPPVVSAPAAVTVEATGVNTHVTFGTATAIDTVSGALIPTNNAPASFTIGATIVTYTATDAAGNAGTATQTVTVVDTTPPAITAPAAVTGTSGNNQPIAVTLGTTTATDLVSGVVPVTNNAPATFPVGTTTVTYTATDAAGNTSTATQLVTIKLMDTTSPVVTAPAAVSIEATGTLTTVAPGTATAADIVSGILVPTNNAPASFTIGTTIVTYTATDAAGNTGTATQMVTVVDTTPPVVTAPVAVTGTSGNNQPVAVNIGKATATDLFPVTVTNNAPATFPVGATMVIWTATDANGNSATATQSITVNLVDTIPPVITVPADVFTSTYTSQATVNLGIASAVDNVDGIVAVTNNAPVTFPVGVTTVTYTAVDAAGNTATATQRVIVSFVSTVGGGTGTGGGATGGGTVTPPTPGGGATVGAEAIYWHHNDHLGTPQALTDINGTVVWTMSQTPFGIATVNEDPDGNGIKVMNNFRFPGQYFDAETGLNYNYQRTYDPAIGSYTQHDPIGLNGGMNTYTYALNNPLFWIDPYGLDITVSLNPNAAARFGHVGLGVNTPNTVGQRPQLGASSIQTGLGLNVPGQISPDPAAPSSVTIPTTPEQDRQAQQCIDTRTQQQQDYNLYNNNCTQFVEQCLGAAGINTPNTILPRRLFNNLQQNFGGNP